MDQTRRGFLRFLGIAPVGLAAAAVASPGPITVTLDVAANDYFDARVGQVSAATAKVVRRGLITDLDEAMQWAIANGGRMENVISRRADGEGWEAVQYTGDWTLTSLRTGCLMGAGRHNWAAMG